MKKIKHQWTTFDGLTKELLYEIMKIRQEVFVVEQECAYLDADALDFDAYHLVGRIETDGEIVSYLRVIKPADDKGYPKVGRVLVRSSRRKNGFAKELMEEALVRIDTLFPLKSIKLSAQCYLQKFYEELGFTVVSEPYDEDGIPHIGMMKNLGEPNESVEKEVVSEKEQGDCIDSSKLSLFVNDMCAEDEKQRILDHIGECKECRDKYTTFMMFNVKQQGQKDSGFVVHIFNTPIHLLSLGLALVCVGALFASLFFFYLK